MYALNLVDINNALDLNPSGEVRRVLANIELGYGFVPEGVAALYLRPEVDRAAITALRAELKVLTPVPIRLYEGKEVAPGDWTWKVIKSGLTDGS